MEENEQPIPDDNQEQDFSENIEESYESTEVEPQETVQPEKQKKKNRLSTVNVLKTSTKAFFIVLWRIVLYVSLGVVVNLLLYILVDSKINLMIDSHRLSFVWNILGYSLISLFLVGFPILYFVLGQKNGVQKAIHYLLNNVKEFLFIYLIDRFFKWVSKNPTLQEKVNENKVNSLLNETLPQYIEKLHEMGFVMRLIYRKFAKKFNFKELMLQEIDEMGGKLDVETLKTHVAEEAAKKVPLVIVKEPKHTFLFILLGINVVVFVVIRFVVQVPV